MLRRCGNQGNSSFDQAQVPELAPHHAFSTAPVAGVETSHRIHSRIYLEQFKALSDADGEELGFVRPFDPGSYEMAAQGAIHRFRPNRIVVSSGLDAGEVVRGLTMISSSG